MNPTTGRTPGRHGGWEFSHTTPDGEVSPDGTSAWAGPKLHYVSRDGCRHCPLADKMRLRRLPKWLADVYRQDARWILPRVAVPTMTRLRGGMRSNPY